MHTMDGISHVIPDKWDLIIAHPPCTYLSNVATRSFSLRCTPAEKVVERWKNRAEAAVFFMYFVLADCEHIAIENPVGFMNTAYRKPDQIIHPYMFATDENDSEQYVTKATCLWLKGLEPLKTNGLPKPDNAAIYGRIPSGKARTWEDTYSRSGKVRSKTFNGIARAMAEQWGGAGHEDQHRMQAGLPRAVSRMRGKLQRADQRARGESGALQEKCRGRRDQRSSGRRAPAQEGLEVDMSLRWDEFALYVLIITAAWDIMRRWTNRM
ncbi:MAG: hypothetical protein IJI06_08845 [Oscillospiraceae bacterium]|nr:hypothetical protein [Oscillospiraceae bacterium]